MKYLLLLAFLLTTYSSFSQDKGVAYFKLDGNAITYMHPGAKPQDEYITDSTVKKSFTIFLEKLERSHVIVKMDGKTTRFKTTGKKEYVENAQHYYYDFENGYRMLVISQNDGLTLLRGVEEKLNRLDMYMLISVNDWYKEN